MANAHGSTPQDFRNPTPPGLSQAEIDKRFTYHPPRDEREIEFYREYRARAKALVEFLVDHTKGSRNQSLAITAIEDAVMRGNAAMALEGHR